MKFTLKKSLYFGLAALTLGGVFAPAINPSANVRPLPPIRVSRRGTNTSLYHQLRRVHSSSLRRIRSDRHRLNVHKANLRKIQHRIRAHRFNTRLIKRFKADKAKLVAIINSNQRGLVRMARAVATEEHEINLIRHGRTFPTVHKHPKNNIETPVMPSALNDRNSENQLPKLANANQDHAYGEASSTYYTDDNGKTNSGANHVDYRDGHLSGYGEHNGNFYTYPNGSLTSAEVNQIDRQINSFNHAQSNFNALNSTVNTDLSRLSHDVRQSFNDMSRIFDD